MWIRRSRPWSVGFPILAVGNPSPFPLLSLQWRWCWRCPVTSAAVNAPFVEPETVSALMPMRRLSRGGHLL